MALGVAAASPGAALGAPHGPDAGTTVGRVTAPHPTGTAASIEVRAAISKRSLEQLHGRRVLRLLEIELDERTPLAPHIAGPLGGDIIRVWIDTPSPRLAVIEVRRTDRPLMRRKLGIGRFQPDIAARVVAIAASEMVHAQARPTRRRHPPKPPPPVVSPEASATWASMAATGALTALWLPAAEPQVALGPELSLSHRRGPTGQQLYARWLTNPVADHTLRWLEVGVGADLRIRLPAPSWRLRLGARAGAVALHLPKAATIDGEPSSPHTWSARGGALLGIETHVPSAGWLELNLEPGAMLRSVDAADHAGAGWSLGGFAMSASLALNVESPPRGRTSTDPLASRPANR